LGEMRKKRPAHPDPGIRGAKDREEPSTEGGGVKKSQVGESWAQKLSKKEQITPYRGKRGG